MASDKPIAVVFGATGGQGGSVARALAADGDWHVRGVTRSKDSDKAKDLEALGVEVVEADMTDAESVAAALEGANSVFLVTQFWQKLDVEDEILQGRTVADAAAKAGVKHLVFSSLEHVAKVHEELTTGPLKKLRGDYVVPHFDGKGIVAEHIKGLGLPATFVQLSFYANNWIGWSPPQKQDDGTWAITMPMADKPMTVLAVEDLGPIVAAILKDPAKHIGATYGLAGDKRPIAEYAAILSDVTGAKVVYNDVPAETFATFFPGADDLANMFLYYQDPTHCVRDVDATKALYADVRDFRSFVEAHRDEFCALFGTKA